MIHARAAKEPKIREAIDNARGLLVDEAEAALAKLVEAGDMTAVVFTLKTIGKGRGYVVFAQRVLAIDGAAQF